MSFNDKIEGIERILLEDIKKDGEIYKGLKLNQLAGAKEGTPVNFIMRIEKIECIHCIKDDKSNPELINLIDRLKLLNVLYGYGLIDHSDPIYVGINDNTRILSRIKIKEKKVLVDSGMAIGILGYKIESDSIPIFVNASYFEYLALKEDYR